MVNSLLPTWAGSGYFPPAYDLRRDYLGVFSDGPTKYGGFVLGTTPSTITGIANPADVIMLAGGAQEGAAKFSLPVTATIGPNTEDWFDLYDADVLRSYVDGTVNGAPNAKMRSAWQKFNGVSNFAFPYGHAKSMSPKSFKVGAFLDPRRFIRDAE